MLLKELVKVVEVDVIGLDVAGVNFVEVDDGAVEDTVPNAAGNRFPIAHPTPLHGLLMQHP
jgi:hypothetical protein